MSNIGNITKRELKAFYYRLLPFLNQSSSSQGTSDYTDLENKPQVNSITLSGNKSLSDLGIPTDTNDLTNTAGFITNTVNNLVNYYLKTETYSKSEVDQIVGAISTLHFEKVNSLPVQNIQTNIIYLLANSSNTATNLYDEYLYVDSSWEIIGSTQIDLSGYVTTTALNTALANYTTTDNLTTLLANKQDADDFMTSADLDEIISVLPINPSSTYIPNTGFTPVGTIISFMGLTAPKHYLACDGTIYNIVQYPVLAKFFKDQFGSLNYFGGDGETTFAVPDLRGEFLRGTGTNSHTNQGSGGNVGVHQDATVLPNENIDANNTRLYVPRPLPWNGKNADSEPTVWGNDTAKVGRAYYNATGSDTYTANSGGSLLTSRPTNTSVLYCIAYQNIYIDAKCNYSTDEAVVGTWIDGKPLYQKTIVINDLTGNWTTAHSYSEIDMDNPAFVIKVGSCKFHYVYGSDNFWFDEMYYTTSNWASSIFNLTEFRIATNYDASRISEAIFTLQYTKTTD